MDYDNMIGHIPSKGTLEDDFPLPKEAYLSFWEGTLKPKKVVQESTCPSFLRFLITFPPSLHGPRLDPPCPAPE